MKITKTTTATTTTAATATLIYSQGIGEADVVCGGDVDFSVAEAEGTSVVVGEDSGVFVGKETGDDVGAGATNGAISG